MVVRVIGGVVVVGPISVDIVSMPTATLANGVETAVGPVAVSILPANPARKTAIIQNTGSADIRVGIAGVTAATGLRVVPNGVVIYDMPFVAVQELFAIQEGAIGSVAFAQEVA